MRAKICYAHDMQSIYDQLFLKTLSKKYNTCLVTFDEVKVVPGGVKIFKLPDLPIKIRPHKVELLIKTPLRLIFFRLYLSKLKPDLLDGCWVTVYGFYSAISNIKPFLATVWGSDVLLNPKNPLLRAIAKYTLKRADGVIVDSVVQENAVIGLGCKKDKIWKFPWGIDLEKFKSSVEGREIKRLLGWENHPIVICTRAHKPIYGIEYLIKAIPLVVGTNPEARFLIIGEGPLTESFKRMVQEYRVEKYVKFIGTIPNEEMPRYLGAASVYVSTSFSDGTSISLLEAMACGLSVIVTDIPGNREWVKDGENGYLVPVKDHVALAEKIKILLAEKSLQDKMRMKNIKLIEERGDWRKNREIFYNAIQSLLKLYKHVKNENVKLN
jgi:glycosyltransferase involved in cell wall biosynthesis